MNRESRRRSPQAESSRRRRREKERDRDRDPNRKSSRDQPATTIASTGEAQEYYRNSAASDSYSRPITTEDRDRSASYAANSTSASKPWVGDNPNYYTAEPEPIPHSSQPPQPRSRTRGHARVPSSSGSDSSSPAYLDISRRYDTSRFGGVLNAFFRAPSEHRRQQRRVKNKAKKRAVFPFNNSSSSSLNSDLAYGDGYIPQSRTSSRRSRSDIRQRNDGGDPFQPGKLQRRQTDEEIVAIGRQLSDLAKRQNDEDLRAAGRSRPSKIMSAAAGLATLNEVRRGKKDGTRGIGSSKPSRRHSDDEDWESATDDDSSDEDASLLAYGASRTNLPGVLGGAAAAAAGAGALWASQSGRRTSEQQRPAVDPSLFGPVNSLNGMVTPVPFRDGDQYNGSGYDRRRDVPTVAASSANAPMRQVYPVPTSQPDQYDARHSDSLAGSRADDLPKIGRPGPAPIQAPVPIAPVPSKVYDAQSLEDAGRREERREERERRRVREDESRGMSSAAKMSFGTAATAAVAAAALKSHHQRGRDDDYRSYSQVAPKKLHRGERGDHERRRSERDLDLSRDADRDARRERERERDRDKERDRERDKEYRKSKDYPSKSKEERDAKRSSRYDDFDDRTSKRSENGKDRDRRSYRREGEEIKVEYDDDKTSRRSRREEKMPADRDLTKDIATGAIVAGGAALAAGALASGSSAPERPLTPAVFTVDREPTFHDWPPRSPSPDVRLSRKDSFEIEKMAEDDSRRGTRSGTEHNDTGKDAKSIYDEVKQATVPVGAAAIAAAAASEKTRGRDRDRRRDEYSDDGSRERSAPVKDAVQEEADRYYREAEAARKVAEEEARSRSRSKGRDRGSNEDEEPEIAIVTPPGYEEEKKLEKSPYDAPNADVRIDNEIFPADTHRFRSSTKDLDAPVFKSRDPSAERERPLLNLVLPTPIPSREPTPAPSSTSRSVPTEEPEQTERSSKKDKKDKKDKKKDKKKGKKSKDRDQQSETPEPGVEVIIGPKGDIVQTPSTPKSVTWGENETKSYEVESPEHERKDTSDKERPRLNKASKWGILAAAIAGSSTEPANEPETVASDTSASRAVPSENGHRSLDDVGEPPIPGPKPGSTDPKHMPGSFADDVEFAGTLAAGLEDAGFDPNIVVNDPTYRRRDSPPGTDELHESGFYKKGFSDTVEDLTKSGEPMTPGSGFVIGETETPTNEEPDEWAAVSSKLTKKEKRKLEKQAAANRQSKDFEDATSSPVPETQTTEEFTEIPLSKKEQKKRAKAAKAKSLAGDDDWETAGQGTETPPSLTQGTDTPPSWEAGEDEWEAPSSKKKKGKNRKSKDFSELDNDKVTVPVDAFSDIQASRDINPDDEWDAPKKKKKSKSSSVDSPSQSAPASEVGSESGSKKKSKRRSMAEDDFNNWDGDPPDRKRVDPFEERDVSSVVSEPRYDERRRDSKSKRSSRYDDDDDTKSIASAPGGSRKSKDSEKRSSGIFSSIFSKSNGHKDDDKKESFLDNAGTLGAGVGLAGAAAAIAVAASSRQHATEASSESEQPTTQDSEQPREIQETFDPEIAPRVIKPAIDPQYGDLLPLPPSEPGSPKETPEELPELPDSRPDTPPEERNLREHERMAHVRRRSAQELPMKSPSRTAIPLQLRLGPRSSPSTPGFLKSSPLNSPGTPDSTGPSKRSNRPTSWDSSRGPIPLQLPRHVRHGSIGATAQDADIPTVDALRELPEAVSSLNQPNAAVDDFSSTDNQSLRLDIGDSQLLSEIAGSQETTPKAEIRPEFPVVESEASIPVLDEEVTADPPGEGVFGAPQDETEPEPIDPMTKNRSSYLLNSAPSSARSDRSIDPEALAQSPPPQSTPSKQRMLGADLSDIPEDLTSADEHFSDAREGTSEDDFFEEARSALSSELSGGSPANTTPTRATFAEPEPTGSELTTVDSDQEWAATSSKKKGKKAKKAAKAAALAASAWDAEADESMMSTPVAGPSTADKGLDLEADIPSVAVSAPDSAADMMPHQYTIHDEQRSLADNEAQNTPSADAIAQADETEFAVAPSKKDKRKKKKDKKQKQSDDTPQVEDDTKASGNDSVPPIPDDANFKRENPETDGFEKSLPADDSAYYPSAAGLHAKTDKGPTSVDDMVNKESYFPSAARVLPVAVPAAVAAGLAAGVALKTQFDKDPSHGAEPPSKEEPSGDRAVAFHEDEWGASETPKDNAFGNETTSTRSQFETHMSEPLFSQDVGLSESSNDRDTSLESTQVEGDTPAPVEDVPVPTTEPVEDEWDALVSTKKSKKNKKKKGALASFTSPEDEPTSVPEPFIPAEAGQAAPTAAEDTLTDKTADTDLARSDVPEAGDDVWATTTSSKKKGKKNKKKQAATSTSWEDLQNEEAAAQPEPLLADDGSRSGPGVGESPEEAAQIISGPVPEPTESAAFTQDSSTRVLPGEPQDERDTTTTSKTKKDKKNKKKGASVAWDEDPKPVEEPTPADVLEDLPTGGSLTKTNEGEETNQPDVSTDTHPVFTTAEGTKPDSGAQEPQADDEWALPKSAKEKKKDKKKKKSQAHSLADLDESVGEDASISADTTFIASDQATREQPAHDEAAGSIEALPSDTQPPPLSDTTADPIGPAEPAEEINDSTALEKLDESVDPIDPVAEEWAPISKKGKKSKKKSKAVADDSWSEDLVAPSGETLAPSQELTTESSAPSADPETEFEVPKKGKKGKKNKTIAFSALDAEPATSSEQISQEQLIATSDTAAGGFDATSVEAEANDETPKKKKGKKAKSSTAFDDWADESVGESALQNPTQDPEDSQKADTDAVLDVDGSQKPEAPKVDEHEGVPGATESLRLLTSESRQHASTDEQLIGNDLETPASGALFAVNDLASPLKPVDFSLPLASLQETVEPAGQETTSDQIEVEAGEATESKQTATETDILDKPAVADSDDSAFMFPVKKKVKKGKKGKKGPAEEEPEPLSTTPLEPAVAEEPLPDTSQDAAEGTQEPDQSKAIEHDSAPVMTESVADTTAKDDFDIGLDVKPSKKDKKKKKGKATAFEELETEDSSPRTMDENVPQATVSPNPADSKPADGHQEDVDLATESVGPATQPEDEWGAPATSKKDKKKKKKQATLAWADDQTAQEEPLPGEADAMPTDTNSPADEDWATASLSKKDKKRKKQQAALDWTQNDTAQEEPVSSNLADKSEAAAAEPEHATSVAATLNQPESRSMEPEAAADDEWAASTSSKKDKKKKKKKQDQAEPDWTQEKSPQESSGDLIPEEPVADAAATISELPEAQVEDEWAAPVLSKKDKKKKKKQAELDWAEESPAPKDIEPADAQVPDTNAAAADEPWEAPLVTKKDKKKKKKKAAAALAWDDDEEPGAATPGTADPVLADDPIAQNDSVMADGSTSTGTAHLDSGADAHRGAGTTHESTGLPSASVDDPEPDFGFSLSKKDKKNKKKKAKNATPTWPDDEPQEITQEMQKTFEDSSLDPSSVDPQDRNVIPYDQYDPHAYSKPTWHAGADGWSKDPSWEEAEAPRDEDEDSWDVTAPKSKKKKKKTSLVTNQDDDAPAPDSVRVPEAVTAAPVKVHAPATSNVDDDDDEWAALVTGSKLNKPNDADDMPWSQSKGDKYDDPSRKAMDAGSESMTAKDIVPEEIATVDDLRQILSGSATVLHEHDEQIGHEATADVGSRGLAAESQVITGTDEPKVGTVTEDDSKAEVTEPRLDPVGSQDQPIGDAEDREGEPTDAWSAPAKLSKKDKKKKKKQQALAWDDTPDPSSPVTEEAPQQMQSTEPDLDRDQVSERTPEELEQQLSYTSEPVIAEPTVDDWTPKKPSKKDKKKAEKAARLAALDQEDPPAETAEPSQLQNPVPEIEQVPEESHPISSQAEPEVDDWTPKKLSKKDKKKAEKAARLAAFDSEDATVETQEPRQTDEPLSDQFKLAGELGDVDDVSSSAQVETGVDEWASKPLSKKEKKKAEKAAHQAALASEDPVPETEESTSVPEPQTIDEPLADETPAPAAPSAEPEEAEFDDWTPKKLSKKDRKKAEKAAAISMVESEEQSAEVVDPPPPSSTAEPVAADASPAVVEEPSRDATPPSEAQPEVDAWAPKLSKKDKKKAEKAARLAALAIEDSPAEIFEPSPGDTTIPFQVEAESVDQPSQKEPGSDDWSSKLSKDDKQEAAQAADDTALVTKEPGTEPFEQPAQLQNAPAAAPETLLAPSEEQAQAEEHGLDSGAPKLSKKDKKKAEKAARLAGLITGEEADRALPEESTSAPSADPLPDALADDNDEWAPKLSKKDKKKAEKAARLASLMDDSQPTEAIASSTSPQEGEHTDAPQDTISQGLLQEPGEEVDEWAPKLSKKDKKKAEKAARLALLGQNNSPEPDAVPPGEVNAPLDEPQEAQTIVPDETVALEVEQRTLSSTEDPSPGFDDWTPKKMSKKDKKKAEQLAEASQLASEDAQDASMPSDTLKEDVGTSADTVSGVDAPADYQPEFDDWAPMKKSKKDKKKAEKLAAAAALSAGRSLASSALSRSEEQHAAGADHEQGQEAQREIAGSTKFGGEDPTSDVRARDNLEPPISELTSTVHDDTTQPGVDKPIAEQLDDPQAPPAEQVRSIMDETETYTTAEVDPVDSTFDQALTSPVQENVRVTEPVPEDDDEWALPVKKKGKKNKKHATPIPEPPQEPSLRETQEPADFTSRDYGSVGTSDPPAEPEAVDEDMWAMPAKSSKKSKKGKKKASQDATPSETPRPASPIRDEPEAGVLQGPTTVDASVEVPPQAEEDPWDVPAKVSKKNKKGKKKASQDPTPTETPRAVSPSVEAGLESSAAQDDPSTAAVESLDPKNTESVADDQWAGEFATPKSKKNKKKDKESALLFTEDPEPASDGHETAQQTSPDDVTATIANPETLQGEPDDRNTEPHDEDHTAMASSQDPMLEHGQKSSGLEDAVPGTESTGPKRSPPEQTRSQESPDQENLPVSEDNAVVQTPLADTIETGDSNAKQPSSRAIKDGSSGPSAVGAAAAGTAAVGGVAAMAEKFGGGKKKKGSKKKKILDKRQPREDDLFDNPALWESADKKGLDDIAVPQETEDFWKAEEPDETGPDRGDDPCGTENDVAAPSQEQEHEKSKAALPTPSSISPGSDSGWKETARQGARLDESFEESPVLGRGEQDTRSATTGLLRLDSGASEPERGLFREDSQSRSLPAEQSFDSPEFGRSPSRGLPVVQEVPETEGDTSREAWPSPEINRDSGFVPDSPGRRSKNLEGLYEEPQRDSGIHTEWDEAVPRTPGNRWEHKLRRSPQSTPRLREPEEQAATPEPEKRQKNYGSLADESTPSRGIAGPGAAAAAALAAGATAASTGRDSDLRSVSESHARTLRDQGASPSPSLSSQRAEQTLRRTASNTSIVRQRTPEPLKFRPESPGIRSTPTPPLRRVNRRISTELPSAPASRETNTPKPVANETKVRVRDKDKDMADVYDGFGEGRIGSPRSPTRPHSMRRRQSMQVLELESRVDQLLAENKLLSDARNNAEQHLSQRATTVLSERDAEIETLKQSLQFLQNEVSRLTEVNDGLTSANAELANKDNSRYAGLEASGDGSRGLDLAAGGAAGAAAGAAATVASYQQSIQEKDDEIADLRAQLEDAKEKVREMQRQILASKAGEAEFLDILDEDHFDHRCQQLCSHVQQWVLRFSKFSDMRACRLTSEINDEKTIDRLDNAVLDGSDVDVYLNDRVRRRDIFMSMTMNMIWEFVFTRYLFGMDREQRQKLKSLEKLLMEVGPPQAVRQWRAVTLTLLSRRDSFKEQRDLDTEAVVQAIFQTLCKILPPPSNLEGQIQSQLRRVLAEAVALSIQMRTQKAEYMMLPPLQPEYDADGELAASVYFNASMMNERSGHSTVSNEDLEAQQAKVRIVLFPLVVKKGDDSGIGDEEIVVCPAQVVVASRHTRRSMAPSSDAGGASLGGAPSRVSVVTEHMT